MWRKQKHSARDNISVTLIIKAGKVDLRLTVKVVSAVAVLTALLHLLGF
ncbi:hypothetical protein [Candidatus Entotheonella palauensis]|nr:hypothetical protein [Candidatus Entotheonella palauensis]